MLKWNLCIAGIVFAHRTDADEWRAEWASSRSTDCWCPHLST